MRLHFTASRSGRAVGMGVRLLAVCAIGAAGGAGVKFLLPKKADPAEAGRAGRDRRRSARRDAGPDAGGRRAGGLLRSPPLPLTGECYAD